MDRKVRSDFCTLQGQGGPALITLRRVLAASAAIAALMLLVPSADAASAPQISSILPAAGLSAGGTEVTLRGSGFSARDSVQFGSVRALSVRFVSGLELIAISPRGIGRVGVAIVGPGGSARSQVPFTYAIWQPGPDTTLQIELQSPPARGALMQGFSAYETDGFDTPAATVTAMHGLGIRAVCYIDAGTYENWRPDAGKFAKAVLGLSNGWPGERWLDIQDLAALEPIMAARLRMCRQKGFDAVDADNVDGYQNRTGFKLTAMDQLRYNRWLAGEAHALGLAIALKNDYQQVAALAPYFNFGVDEQCFDYSECGALAPFARAHKPAFVIEYGKAPASFCPLAKKLGVTAFEKRLSLGAFILECPMKTPTPPYRISARAKGQNGVFRIAIQVLGRNGAPVPYDGLILAPGNRACGGGVPQYASTDAVGEAVWTVRAQGGTCAASVLELSGGATTVLVLH